TTWAALDEQQAPSPELYDVASHAPPSGPTQVQSPSWEDDTHLAFMWNRPTGKYPWIIHINAKSLREASRRSQSDGLAWHGYYGTSRKFLGSDVPRAGCAHDAPRVVVFSPTTGTPTKTLFTMPTA